MILADLIKELIEAKEDEAFASKKWTDAIYEKSSEQDFYFAIFEKSQGYVNGLLKAVELVEHMKDEE